ncbi:hypothetical protein SBADM41S_08009 [Streptomyces badius]
MVLSTAISQARTHLGLPGQAASCDGAEAYGGAAGPIGREGLDTICKSRRPVSSREQPAD